MFNASSFAAAPGGAIAAVFVRFDFFQRDAAFLVDALRRRWEITSAARRTDRAPRSLGEDFIRLKVRLELRPRRHRQQLVRVRWIGYCIDLNERARNLVQVLPRFPV